MAIAQVGSLTGIIAISAGPNYSLFLKNDGTVWACGSNYSGELGDGTLISQSSPVQATSLTGITALAAGYSHSLFVKGDGTVMACGWNSNGQLGDGSITTPVSPIPVSSLTGITSVKAGYKYSLFLKNDGTLWACGKNTYGELGDGTTADHHTAVQVNGLCQMATSLNEINETPGISIFPNPSSGRFQLTTNNMQSANGELEIYNMLGEKVYSNPNILQQNEINLSNFSKGIYFVKYNDGTKKYNQKIIVQ